MAASRYALDTHALIWHLGGNRRLGAAAKAALEAPESRLYLPIIALAEACWIVERGRTGIPDPAALVADVEADPRLEGVPLNLPILIISQTLSSIHEMHDRHIVATAIWLGKPGDAVALLTRDEDILASGAVQTIW